MSRCPQLDVVSQGDTFDDAKKSLEEAISLWLESCILRGTLQRALQEMGFNLKLDPAEGRHTLVAHYKNDDDVLGDAFPLSLEIPAYQAAQFMTDQ